MRKTGVKSEIKQLAEMRFALCFLTTLIFAIFFCAQWSYAAPVLDKIASTSAAAVGDVITFTISVNNPDSDPTLDVVATDILPAGMTYATHTATVGTLSVAGQTLTWTIPTLPANGNAHLTLAVSLSGQGVLINTVTSPGAVSASATVLVLASAITHFRMDEPVDSWTGAAGEVIDSGGTALHGRLLPSAASTSTNVVDPVPSISSQHALVGRFCNAASFDGNAVVQVADSPLFDYTTQLSASVWVYPTAYPPSDLYSILSNDVNYEFHLNGSGHLFWWWQASTLTSANAIPLDQWSHIVITLDSSPGVRRQRIYINGVLDGNTNNWQGTLSTNNCNFHIGGDVATSASCPIITARNFRGMIDEVKLYNFELTQQEVLADMTLGRSCSGTFDHLRIEHDGVASICAPERVTIKACMDSDCSALYPGNVTVNLSPSGWVDGGTFTMSGGIGTRQLSINTPGDITLGTTSVSPAPAFSSRCFNGATETCTLNFADVSCDFDAVESGANPQTAIHTKLSGVSFDIDVLALLDPSIINTAYLGTVAIDLVDATGSACPTGVGLNTATDITYGSGDAGRIMVSFNYPNAARDVRVRATVASSAPACSNDNFSIRPQTFTVSSSVANNTALTASPTVVAGTQFSLSANAVAGYDGTPTVDNTQLTGTPVAGTLSGNFPAASSISGTATGINFTYSEVGHFGLNQNGVYDDTFTAVDQPSDCNPGYSNVLSAGKYGCSFGSTSVSQVVGSSGFGRFIPARFNISNNTPLFDNACNNIFTYMGQPFGYLIDPELTVTALNSGGVTTLNYGGSYWKLSSSLWGRSYTNNAVTASIIAPTVAGSVTWGETVDSDGVGTVEISGEELSYSKPASPELPFTADADLAFTEADLTDSDGVCYDPENDSICNSYTINSIIGGEQRYGRMQLQNAYGPETLPLTISVLTEYYNGTGFVLNSLDSCTSYDSLHLALNIFQGNLTSGETTASGSGALLSGIGNNLSLSASGLGNDGSVDLEYDLDTAGLEWLKSGGNNPVAKATFGIFKGNQRLIYMRESIW